MTNFSPSTNSLHYLSLTYVLGTFYKTATVKPDYTFIVIFFTLWQHEKYLNLKAAGDTATFNVNNKQLQTQCSIYENHITSSGGHRQSVKVHILSGGCKNLQLTFIFYFQIMPVQRKP